MNRPTFRIIAASLLLLSLIPVRSAFSQSRVITLEHDDLSVRVDIGWPGGGKGGYYPLRFRIVNLGESRTLTIQVKPQPRDTSPTVKRTIEAVQNETRPLTLSIPLVGFGSKVTLEVLDESGKVIDGMQRDLTLPQVQFGDQTSPAVLVISDAAVRLQGLEQFASLTDRRQQEAPRGSRRSATRTVSLDAGYVAPVNLPESWIDYTSVDLVFVDLVTLGRLWENQRLALKQWVQCGGTLVVYNVNDAPDRSEELNRLLDLKTHAAVSRRWEPASDAARSKSRATFEGPAQQQEFGRILPEKRVIRPGTPIVVGNGRTVPVGYRWTRVGNPFSQRQLMWGTVVAFRSDPFNGTAFDWAWLFESLGPQHCRWENRHGFSAREETKSEFLKFLIPGVTGVPTYSFLFLITAFTILIGPVNYFFLWKRKRLFFLVLTIPVIAFVTSLTLFGYSMMSHGFTVKTRIRSLTILDQRRHEAVTMSRVALFAGFPPSNGLRFSQETAVYPLWANDTAFEAGTLDWTDGQQMTSGWLRSRTRTQFFTVSHRRERGRLEIGMPKDGKIPVTNGFPWAIEALLLADNTGKLYFTPALAAGQSAGLTPVESSDLQKIDTLLARFPLELPDGVSETTIQNSSLSMRRRGMSNRGYEGRTVLYHTNQLESAIAQLRKIRASETGLAPQSYLAILAENPDVDLGLKGAKEFDGYHLLLGYY